jgi:hypothetical protein
MAQKQEWVPPGCTLPLAERALRVAEFDQLFASALRSVHRFGADTARLVFDAAAEPATLALTARESDCCSFFTFTITRAGDRMLLDVTVPPAKADVLDALVAHARAACGTAA